MTKTGTIKYKCDPSIQSLCFIQSHLSINRIYIFLHINIKLLANINNALYSIYSISDNMIWLRVQDISVCVCLDVCAILHARAYVCVR